MMMKKMAAVIGLLALCAQAFGQAETESAGDSPQLWVEALFDAQGQVAEIAPVDEASQPKALWAQLLPRLKQARIEPMTTSEGQPASFRTGMLITLGVVRDASGAGSVKIQGLKMLPVVLKEYAASYPLDAGRSGGWQGAFTAICTVGAEGRCTKVDVQATAGMPESVRRFARVSMEGWRFKPQEINGQPIEGKYAWSVRMETLDNVPKDFRDPRKL